LFFANAIAEAYLKRIVRIFLCGKDTVLFWHHPKSTQEFREIAFKNSIWKFWQSHPIVRFKPLVKAKRQ
jgi:hypothetical protein